MKLKEIENISDILRTKVRAKIYLPNAGDPDEIEGYLYHTMGETWITEKHPDEEGEKRLYLIDPSEYPLGDLDVL